MGGMPTPPPTSRARGRLRVGPERLADRAQHADDVAHMPAAQRAQTRADDLVEDLDPALGGIHALDRQRAAHGHVRIAGEVHEAAGLGARGAFRRRDAQHELLAGPGFLRDAPCRLRERCCRDARDVRRDCARLLGSALKTSVPRSPLRAPPCARRRRCAPGRGSPIAGRRRRRRRSRCRGSSAADA